MYTEYFKLNEAPFKLTPNPRYLFMSELHREGLAHLVYGVRQPGGFVQLTGEVGSGKTTLCRCLINQIPQDTDVALIVNPKLTAIELLATICDELRVAYPSETNSVKILIDALNQHLLEAHARGRRTVLIIDEAQHLKSEVLEQIRLLTNLETSQEKLLQIIILGQPELLSLLKQRKLRQLAQRITARYHLEPLSRKETYAYVQHRLLVAGRKEPLFTRRALSCVYQLSGGIPRLINIICDRALLGAYSQNVRTIYPSIIRNASKETGGRATRTRRFIMPAGSLPQSVRLVLRTSRPRRLRLAWPVSVLLVLTVVVFFYFPEYRPASEYKDESEVVFLNDSYSSSLSDKNSMVEIPVSDLPQLGEDEPEVEILDSQKDWELPLLPAVDVPTPTLVDMLSITPWDVASSFADLFTLWGVALPESLSEPACAEGIIFDFECLFQSGGWPRLRRYDLPVVLDLVPPDVGKRRVVLSGLDDDTATIIVQGRRLNVQIQEIAKLWDGSFMLFWKPPVVERPVSTGAVGESVEWVQRTLDRLDGKPDADVSGVFDAELKQRIINFQKKYSLVQDGLVGNETLARLALALEWPESLSLTGRGHVENAD